jgi:hypothetical protein
MTAYPSAGDYYKALQTPARTFTVDRLQKADFVWDSLGPTLMRGSSAVVFQAAVGGTPTAVRCFIRNDASSQERYAALGAYLATHYLSPYVLHTTWLDSAIRVSGGTWPVLLMDWIDGRTLDEYVEFLVASSNTDALAALSQRWRELVRVLQESEFAHGDFQHGDIMVDQQGGLRLVDYDGVWVPLLADMAPPTEYGHPNYEHPGGRVWGRWMDTFPALVIYLSLVALAKDPGLWPALYNSKNLLFTRADLFPPFETGAWRHLAALHDEEVDELSGRLQECCAPGWVAVKSLEEMLSGPTPPPPSSGPGKRSEATPSRGYSGSTSRGYAGWSRYEKPISTKDPGCLIVLFDRSASMRRTWANTQETLADGVARTLNELLLELLFASLKEPGKFRYYFDVGVFGYGVRPVAGGEGVESAFGGALAGKPLVALPELRDNPLAIREVPSVDVGVPPVRAPVWVEPASGHRTPMCQALAVARKHAHDWASGHPDSFPPVVINITDGMVTDSPYEGASIEEWAQRLFDIQTTHGPLLLFNIFLSRMATNAVMFPATDSDLPEPSRVLFRISSPIPPSMAARAKSAGMPLQAGARGWGLNADAKMLVRFLEIGTRVEIETD